MDRIAGGVSDDTRHPTLVAGAYDRRSVCTCDMTVTLAARTVSGVRVGVSDCDGPAVVAAVDSESADLFSIGSGHALVVISVVSHVTP